MLVYLNGCQTPAVSRMEKWTHSRGIAVGIIYLLLLLLVITFFFFVGPRIAHQAQRLGDAVPQLLDQVSSGNIAVTIGQERGWSATTIHQAQAFLNRHRDDLIALAQRIGLRAAEAARTRYSWARIGEQTVDLYRELAGGTPSAPTPR